MRFGELRGHESVLEGLWRAARERRLAHALTFVGAEGVGKFLAAERFAAGLLCARGIGPPCGTCGPCKRLRIDSHPDVLVVDPTQEGLESISIGHVTPRPDGPKAAIGQFLSLRAMENGWRIVLVRESDRLVEEAQNALLKTLEEPGEDTLLVLETARPDRLLATIHSRCVRVPFGALARTDVERVLGAQGVGPDELGELSVLCDGAPGKGLALARAGVFEMLAIQARAFGPDPDPFGRTAEWEEIDGVFPGKTPTAQARAKARIFLDLLASIVRDAARIRAGLAAGTLPFGVHAARIAAAPEITLESALEGILAARQDVEQNLAPDAAVERALLACEPLARVAVEATRC